MGRKYKIRDQDKTDVWRAGKKNLRNRDFQFWQQNNYPIELSTKEMMDQRLNYIHNNSIEADFLREAERWEWSSAKDCFGVEKGKLDLIYIE